MKMKISYTVNLAPFGRTFFNYETREKRENENADDLQRRKLLNLDSYSILDITLRLNMSLLSISPFRVFRVFRSFRKNSVVSKYKNENSYAMNLAPFGRTFFNYETREKCENENADDLQRRKLLNLDSYSILDITLRLNQSLLSISPFRVFRSSKEKIKANSPCSFVVIFIKGKFLCYKVYYKRQFYERKNTMTTYELYSLIEQL
jgi:hypothetical protein